MHMTCHHESVSAELGPAAGTAHFPSSWQQILWSASPCRYDPVPAVWAESCSLTAADEQQVLAWGGVYLFP